MPNRLKQFSQLLFIAATLALLVLVIANSPPAKPRCPIGQHLEQTGTERRMSLIGKIASTKEFAVYNCAPDR